MSSLRSFVLATAILTIALTLFQGFWYLTKARPARTRPDLFGTFKVLTILNFLACWLVAGLSGGDALNGKIVGDQYFLGGHGRYTSVSFSFWLFSLIHTWATILSFLAVFVGQFFRIFGRIDKVSDRDKLHSRGRGTV